MRAASSNKARKTITAAELDALLGRDEDAAPYADFEKAVAVRRVEVELSGPVLRRLEREARRRETSCQAVIESWLGERIDAERRKRVREGS